MKIARLLDGKSETFGIISDRGVATRDEITYTTGVPLPLSLKDFLFDGWLDEVRESLGDLGYERGISEFDMLAPINNPPKILCLAFNYMDHAREQERVPPADPVTVMKPRTALCGHNDEIIIPRFVTQLDYEIELAVIIGRDCKDIDPDGARECIFGYTILNDVSARDIQYRDGQFTRAKGFDTFAPCGPWIVTSSELGDPGSLRLVTRINGEIRQDSSTAMMRHDPFEVVSRLSMSATLEKGDIISTGTPAGVAMNTPGAEYLSDGDEIEMEIERIGTLRNTVHGAHIAPPLNN